MKGSSRVMVVNCFFILLHVWSSFLYHKPYTQKKKVKHGATY